MCGLLIARTTNPKNLYFSLIDKHQMLQEREGPRIILVGGSNLSFGINSKLIQDSLGVNVINTSVHAGLGLKFMMDDVVRFIKKGDIVILAPEYEHFFGNTFYGNEPAVNTIIAIPETFRFLSFHNWKEILGILPETAVKNIIKFGFSEFNRLMGVERIGIYDRGSFNEYGDVTAHYNMKGEDFKPPLGITGDFNDETIKAIISFRKRIEHKESLFLFTYPCLMDTSFNSITEQFKMVNFKLNEAQIKIIGTPQRYSLNDSLYFNSQYHLTKEGINIRTNHLIEDLQENTIFMSHLKNIKRE